MRWAVVVAGLLLLATPASAEPRQLGSLISPGPLSAAHKTVDGAANCSQCHETGRRVTPQKCLTCHKPIVDRIARRFGVHKNADAGCVSCHTEHAGADADLRHFDQQKFDHAADTRFPLDGMHQATAAKCAACHRTRSFLQASSTCAPCHNDPHKASLGTQCERCHSSKTPFKASRTSFNHADARFQLTGAHVRTKCESCHKTQVFRGSLAFSTCQSCHNDPHAKRFGDTCTTCHSTERWTTSEVNHARTAFPLVGAHTKVACAGCHTKGPATAALRFDTCSACHVNVHRESIKEDCKRCHTETTFKGATFDHNAKTRFVLDGKHVGVVCAKCHTGLSPPTVPLARQVLDYRGAKSECVACHGPTDPHKGTFGRTCDSCHKTVTFDVKGFKHAGAADFYLGSHTSVTCDRCHVPERTLLGKGTPHPKQACVSCHRDVHLGQVETACETCHSVDAAHFAASRFVHTRSRFALTGKHETTACAKCHVTETRLFPSGAGTAMRLKPLDTLCKTCHADVHLGQVDTACDSCHRTAEFKVTSYKHRGMEDFFTGFHGKYTCVACHKQETGVFPTGRGSAIRFMVGKTCAACHAK